MQGLVFILRVYSLSAVVATAAVFAFGATTTAGIGVFVIGVGGFALSFALARKGREVARNGKG